MSARAAVPALFLALLLSCDSKPQKAEIHIQIKLQGSGFASPQELGERNRLQDDIERRKIGEVVDAGSGMGVMDLSVVVTDPGKAKEQILQLLSERKLTERATVSGSAAN